MSEPLVFAELPHFFVVDLGGRKIMLNPLDESFEYDLNQAVGMLRAWALLVRANQNECLMGS
jgi:hypothetical protein